METAPEFKILDEVDCISYSANTLVKRIQLFSLQQ